MSAVNRKLIEWRQFVTLQLPLILAQNEGLTAEDVHFLVTNYLGVKINLRRLRQFLPSEARAGKRSRLRRLPLPVLERIKELKDEDRGYCTITNILRREFGLSISEQTIRLAIPQVEALLEEKRREEAELKRIEEAMDRGEASLKELVTYARKRRNEKVDRAIKDRLKRYLRMGENSKDV